MPDWRIAAVAKLRAEAEDFRGRAKQHAAWSAKDAAHYEGFAKSSDELADLYEVRMKEEGVDTSN